MSNRFLSIREASEFLRVSQSAVRLWIAKNRLKAVRAGSRVLIDREYLVERAATGELLELPSTKGARRGNPTQIEPQMANERILNAPTEGSSREIR